MRIFVVDAGLIDRSLLLSHLEPQYGQHVEVFDVGSNIDVTLEQAKTALVDAMLVGRPEHAVSRARVVDRLASELPGVPLVVVQPSDEPPVPVENGDKRSVSFVSQDQLALLPSLIEQMRSQSPRAMADSAGAFTDQALAMDPFQIIASQASDYVYSVEYEPDGAVRRRLLSDGVCRLTGFSSAEIAREPLSELVHPDDRENARRRTPELLAGKPRVDEYRLRTRTGRICWVRDYARPLMSKDGTRIERIVGAGQDITNQKLAQLRLSAQASVLGLIAQGEPTPVVLRALIEMIEAQIPDARCSIQIVDQSGRFLHHQAASQLPDQYIDELGPIPITPEGGACGNAALSGELVICRDLIADPRTRKYADITTKYGLRAVWSNPILAADSTVVGTFATYYDSVRDPQDFEISLLEVAAQLAGIALEKERRETDLLFAEVRYRALVEQTPVATFVAVPENPFSFSYMSPQFGNYFDIPLEKVVHAPHRIWPRIHPDDRAMVKQSLDHSVVTGDDLEVEFRIDSEASVTWIQCKAVLLRDRQGYPTHWQGVMLDVTERNEANRRLAESEQQYRSLFEDNLNAVFTYDLDGRIRTVNPAAERIAGYSQDELIGQDFHSILAPDQHERAQTHMAKALEGKPQQTEITVIGKNGNRIDLNISKSPIMVKGEIVGVSGIAEDVTERKRLESELVHQAYHDPLTGLPNRTYFFEHLSGAFAGAGEDSQIAVLFLDLNNFKVINDSLGHDVGDQYLQRISCVLQSSVPAGSLVARFGGDEFTILLPGQPDAAASARTVANELMAVLRQSIVVNGYELGTNISIGIAVSKGEAGDTPHDVVRRADIALYDAKQSGHDSRYALFNQGMDEWVFERLWIERDLRQAVQTDQIQVHYQPLIDLQTGRVSAVEALIRWQHPTRGMLPPGRFLRVAEETGHIIELDSKVLEAACEEVVKWNQRRPEGPALHLGVNVSAREFWHAGFVERVTGILEQTGFDPRLLRIEITESTMMQDVGLASSLVEELRRHGVQFVIDDFGTGYSSLSYLRQFPVDALKIDRSFIQSLDENEMQQGVIRAVIGMARAMNLRVVAEGVETPEQYRLVKSLGCDLAQGFLMARPKPFAQLESMLSSDQPWDAQRAGEFREPEAGIW